jgi:hypothetical protein
MYHKETRRSFARRSRRQEERKNVKNVKAIGREPTGTLYGVREKAFEKETSRDGASEPGREKITVRRN